MKKILISLSVISLISVTVLVFILSIDRNKVELTVNDENENQIIESNNSIEEEEEILDESITDNNENIESDSNVIHNNDIPSNKNNKKVNNSSNTNVIRKQEEVVKKPEEPKNVEESQQDIKIEEPIEEKPKEVVNENIVDTNSFFYSIHHGKIEMSSQSKCLSAGEEIAFIDTVDINYYRCYEVTSTTGKILGYYLNIFCNSDNCNRYKNQIDMSKYK